MALKIAPDGTFQRQSSQTQRHNFPRPKLCVHAKWRLVSWTRPWFPRVHAHYGKIRSCARTRNNCSRAVESMNCVERRKVVWRWYSGANKFKYAHPCINSSSAESQEHKRANSKNITNDVATLGDAVVRMVGTLSQTLLLCTCKTDTYSGHDWAQLFTPVKCAELRSI